MATAAAAIMGNGQAAAVAQNHERSNHNDTDESKSRISSTIDLEKGSDTGVPEDNDDAEIKQPTTTSTTPPPTVPAPPPPKDPNLVEWDGPNDPQNPLNWPRQKRWLMTVILATNTWIVTFASSVFGSAIIPVAEEYNVKPIVSTLATALFILGWGVGPLIWGPGSEAFGRKRPLYTGFAIFTIMQIPIAVAQNIQTILVCQFFAGVFGSAPLAIVGGIFADIWDPVDRGIAFSVFSTTTFIGPVIGPIIGGFVTQSHLGWRWVAWITLILAGFFGTLGVIFVPETSHSRLLQLRAQKLRYETKNWAYHAKADEQPLNRKTILTVYLFRPFQMIVSEPILLLITIYTSYIYGILYLFIIAYPISFQEERRWGQGVGSLPFLAIMIGVLLGAVSIAFHTRTRFARRAREAGRAVPEERLVPMMFGAVLLPVGLFWFGWTSDPDVSWVPQVISGAFFGCGIFLIFMPGVAYLVDVYLWVANSALSANTFLRSLAGGAFPLFGAAMYHKLGVNWATSVLGFLSLVMMPAPFLFFFYGHRIRALSKWAPKLP